MSYKTVLVQVDPSELAPQRIRIAAQIALAENAHLIGAAVSGGADCVYQDHAFDLTMTIATTQRDALLERACDALAKFDAIASGMGVLSYEKRLIDDEAEGGLAVQARYSDLVVVSQTDPGDSSSGTAPGMPERVLLDSARPVLIIPYAGNFNHVWKRVLVAWDGSAEAIRAIAGALPLLRRAEHVTVALINPPPSMRLHGTAPGTDIALYLARHQIKVDVLQTQVDYDIGNALLSLAAELGSDMIVMGGYGHARLRELLAGGVTLTVLKTMTVPVLMSH